MKLFVNKLYFLLNNFCFHRRFGISFPNLCTICRRCGEWLTLWMVRCWIHCCHSILFTFSKIDWFNPRNDAIVPISDIWFLKFVANFISKGQPLIAYNVIFQWLIINIEIHRIISAPLLLHYTFAITLYLRTTNRR